ncbi:nucleoside triphosphate hydrolase [Kiloniella litopenaei]|uniref:nucleoside triphosphate hydrolase n=1 Tax=Kiloniella litopenaei TaxID=1549748 RepID=UPI0009E47811|nr:nucleoside triphosphate hydrolase [Kiloniella litopenaei]
MLRDNQSIKELATYILSVKGHDNRFIISIAGPPGSGKSTLSADLCDLLNNQFGREEAVVMPMDGYHLENTILEQKGLLSRKGSPDTFDVESFLYDLHQIYKKGAELTIPVFDREQDCSIPHAKHILKKHHLILVEGNYLLLKDDPWHKVKSFVDLSVFLKVPMKTLEERLIKRWLDHGFARELATKRALSNDIPNAHLVNQNSLPADIVLEL